MTSEIIWKKIDEIPRYEISTTGKIRNSITRKILKTTIRGIREGYESIKIKEKHYLIHRLVANAFLEKIKGKPFVDHIDRNKLNNDVSNLRWVNSIKNFINSKRGDLNNIINFTGIKYHENSQQWIVYVKGQNRDPLYYDSLKDAYISLSKRLKF